MGIGIGCAWAITKSAARVFYNGEASEAPVLVEMRLRGNRLGPVPRYAHRQRVRRHRPRPLLLLLRRLLLRDAYRLPL